MIWYLFLSGLFFILFLGYYVFKRDTSFKDKLLILFLCFMVLFAYLSVQEYNFRLKIKPKYLKVLIRKETLNPYAPFQDTAFYFPIEQHSGDTISLFLPQLTNIIIWKSKQ